MCRFLLLLLPIFVFSHCIDPSQEMPGAQRFGDPDATLHHQVFLNLKDSLQAAELDSLYASLNQLGKLEGVLDFHIGQFENLSDPRALSSYELVLTMAFRSISQYRNYQRDPRHIKVRGDLKVFLAAPPATYDFFRKLE